MPLAVADGETGLLVAGHGTPEWVEALEQLLIDDETRIRMGESAVAHAKAFSWSASAEQLLSVYAGTLDGYVPGEATRDAGGM